MRAIFKVWLAHTIPTIWIAAPGRVICDSKLYFGSMLIVEQTVVELSWRMRTVGVISEANNISLWRSLNCVS